MLARSGLALFLAVTADGLRMPSRRSALGFGTVAFLVPQQRALADMQGTPFGPCALPRVEPSLQLTLLSCLKSAASPPRNPVLHRRRTTHTPEAGRRGEDVL